jgi:hypothetical protein
MLTNYFILSHYKTVPPRPVENILPKPLQRSPRQSNERFDGKFSPAPETRMKRLMEFSCDVLRGFACKKANAIEVVISRLRYGAGGDVRKEFLYSKIIGTLRSVFLWGN